MKKYILTAIIFLMIANSFSFAQKDKIKFKFEKAKHDTIKFTDLTENTNLITNDSSYSIKSYNIKILVKKQFVILPITGTKVGPQLMSFLKEIKPRPKSIIVQDITAAAGEDEIIDKGFTLYLK